jgi:hypothetical protein
MKQGAGEQKRHKCIAFARPAQTPSGSGSLECVSERKVVDEAARGGTVKVKLSLAQLIKHYAMNTYRRIYV